MHEVSIVRSDDAISQQRYFANKVPAMYISHTKKDTLNYTTIDRNLWAVADPPKIKDVKDYSGKCPTFNTDGMCNDPDMCVRMRAKTQCHNCDPRCGNQTIQPSQFVKLNTMELRELPVKGFGLFTLEYIAKGTVIMEYTGEIIKNAEYEARNEANPGAYYGFSYGKTRRLDPRYYGNLARFMNHACFPNCEPYYFYVRGYKRLFIIAEENILSGEEITISYGNTSKLPFCCNCQHVDCKKPYSSTSNIRNYSVEVGYNSDFEDIGLEEFLQQDFVEGEQTLSPALSRHVSPTTSQPQQNFVEGEQALSPASSRHVSPATSQLQQDFVAGEQELSPASSRHELPATSQPVQKQHRPNVISSASESSSQPLDLANQPETDAEEIVQNVEALRSARSARHPILVEEDGYVTIAQGNMKNRTRRQLDPSTVKNEPIPMWACAYPWCPKSYTTKKKAFDHFRQNHLHSSGDMECSKCHKTCSTVANKRNHENMCNGISVPNYNTYYRKVENYNRSRLAKKPSSPPADTVAEPALPVATSSASAYNSRSKSSSTKLTPPKSTPTKSSQKSSPTKSTSPRSSPAKATLPKSTSPRPQTAHKRARKMRKRTSEKDTREHKKRKGN